MSHLHRVCLLIAVLLSGCSNSASPSDADQESPGPLTLPSTNVIDLTHAFNSETVYWPTENGFRRTITAQGPSEQGYHYESATFSSSEHGGTHVDAPVHFWEGAHAVDQIPPDQLMGPAVVIDVSEHVESNPDYQIAVEDITDWESTRRPIPDGSIVLFHTGLGSSWPDPQQYLGTTETGQEAVSQLHFPGLHPDAAAWLIENRSIKAVGIDTPSIDYGQSQDFLTHRTLFEQNLPALENLANLDQVPPEGAIVVGLPMKIEGGSGAPVRVVAFVP